MMKNVLLTALVSILMSVQAYAAVTVLGSAEGQDCYYAARSASFGGGGISACNEALRNGSLDRTETAGTHINRGILYLRAENYDKAFDDFQSALKIVPNMPEAYVNRGNVFFHRRDYNAALADYTAAINGNTKQLYAAYYNRGLVHERMGNKAAAIEDFKQANTLNPSWQEPADKLKNYGETPLTE